MTELVVPRDWIDGEECHVPDLAVHELFLLQARRNPGAIALRQWSKRLSYGKLAATSTKLARSLLAMGMAPGDRVGICMRRSPQLPASEMGVLLTHGTFVPLDPDQPAQRLRAIVEDAAIDIALVDSEGERMLTGVVGRLINVGAPGAAVMGRGDLKVSRVNANDLAYIMYTSGSTGRPKGVMVSHKNLAAFIAAANQCLGGPFNYRQAAFAAIGFDVAVYEFFTPLVCGASIQLVPEAERADANRLQRFLEVHQTTRVFLPPVLTPLLDPDRLPCLREVIVGGEACDPRQVERWASPGVRKFYNWYGPTETTIAVLGVELDGSWSRPLPLGRPLPGSSVYIVDAEGQICPPRVVGELLIGGPQVTQGYVNSPRDRAHRYVPDLFTPGTGAGHILYRTGDLAVWDEAGLISFLGRADRQVKIHGQRVEPGEIEAVLSGHPRVTQAIVDIVGSAVRAYVTPLDAPSSEELRGYCTSRLPKHMVPISVIAMADVPLTVNAKVDFGALRRIGEVAVAEQSTALAIPGRPRTEVQQVVAGEWAVLFGAPGAALDEDFFLAGGDSLAAMRLASALRRRTGRDLTAEDIFAGRTLDGIAARVKSAAKIVGAELPRGSAPALSSAQLRLWFTEQFAPGTPVHNIVLAEHMSGRLQVDALSFAFQHVVKRQMALCWRLRPGDGLPLVTVSDPSSITIPVRDLSALARTAREAQVSAILDEEACTPVDLTGGPLWRTALLRLGHDEHILVMTLHHIIFDGWSQAILYRELGQAYRREITGISVDDQPDAVKATFADYTAWTLDLGKRRGSTDVAWWKRHLAGAPTVLDLPRDRPRPAVVTFSGARRTARVGAELTGAVMTLATAEGTTPGVVLLSAFSVLLCRLTGESEHIVGVPLADRGRAPLEDLVGFLIRPLPLRLRVDHRAAFSDHVRRCKAELAAARQHVDAPLDRIIEQLDGGRDLTRNPLYQVMFNVYNFPEAQLELPGLVVHPVQAGIPGSLVDLTLYVIRQGEDLRLDAVYNSDLYDGARIEALLDSYVHLLLELVGTPQRSVGEVSARPRWTRLPDWSTDLGSDVPDIPGLLEQVRSAGRAAPDAAAIQDEDQVLRYRDVLDIIDAAARRLSDAKIRRGDVIAVLARRIVILPPVLLGILSVGARWAILDRELPDEVLTQRLSTVRPAAVILCGDDMAVPEPWAARPVLDIAELALPVAEVRADVEATDRGYLSFTSGSTGEPKVIATTEAPLVHFLNWYRSEFALGPSDRFALLGGLAHDPLLRDMFTPLTSGATLLVPGPAQLGDPSRLLSWLADRHVTVAHFTPQLVRMMAAGSDGSPVLEALRLVAVAGDQLTTDDVTALRTLAPRARVLNFYGTTETPQAHAFFEVRMPQGQLAPASQGAMPVPVGEGIDGVQLLVMSDCGRPTTVGELGEVVIRSRYLSSGYVNHPQDGQFLDALPGAGKGRAFRTGDLGRYGPAGEVILAGRADDQVKVRGFRVELGEVEAALRTHPDVEQAVVRHCEHQGTSMLHAYIVGTPAITESDVLRQMRTKLPTYAVPSSITVLRALPITAAGKVDRDRLPEPWRADPLPAVNEVPESGLEQVLQAIWCEVLGVPRIHRDDSFFEVGGNSMAIIEVRSKLMRTLGRKLPVVDFFRFPTIRDLAGHLAGTATTTLLDADRRGRLRRQRTHRSVGRTNEGRRTDDLY
jgi:amino acid adenylation domain-containing protein